MAKNMIHEKMVQQLTYDDALKRVENIVSQLEEAEAISLDEYKRLAAEATALLQQCKKEIEGVEKELSNLSH